jgi:spermidine/putrescine transport system permease protein
MRYPTLRWLQSSYMGLVYVLLYLPILVLIIYSFNNARFSMLWQGGTLDWYRLLFSDGSLWQAALNSLLVAVLSASVASVLGLCGAVSFYRYRFLGKQFFHGLVFVLIVIPDIVLGIALLVLFSSLKIQLGFWSLLLAHITFCLPFALVSIYSRFGSLDKKIFEAAKDLGAHEITIFTRIILPLLWPGIISGWLLAFTLSLDDIMISYFVSGPNFEILPLRIYSMVRHGISPEINALCSIIFALTLVFVLLSQWILHKKS